MVVWWGGWLGGWRKQEESYLIFKVEVEDELGNFAAAGTASRSTMWETPRCPLSREGGGGGEGRLLQGDSE